MAHQASIPKVRIVTRQGETLVGKRIVVVIDGWASDSRYPSGHYVKTVGPVNDKLTENEVLLIEHDVPHGPFSENVLACLPPRPYTIPPEEIAKRRDLRHIPVCSIDPPGCTGTVVGWGCEKGGRCS